MENIRQNTGVNSGTVQNQLIKIIEDITSDWDTGFSGQITGETRLMGDLAFESVDVVHLIVAIQERFGKHDIPFEDLVMENGRYVNDLQVSRIADFLKAHI
ncbi:MAG TPA: acyl carrier protein [Nitrospiria bacterium]|nr:acyl carrier protein [Nitrospiria bacterium]